MTRAPGSGARPAPADEPAIRCADVAKHFGTVTALDRLSLTVPRGRVFGYLGSNGAGKTTTLRLLMDLSRPTSGTVEVLGSDPRRGGAELRRRIGYLPGELRLDDRLGVEETLQLWADLRGGVDPRRMSTLCEQLELDVSRRVHGLSSGNRRKVGLVGAFMSDPELLVLDEPTAGLDPLMQEQFLGLVEQARLAGSTVFLSSHVLSEVARVADEVLVLRAGRLIARGDVPELRRLARQPFTAWFSEVPPVDALRRTAGVGDLEVRGPEVSGVLSGSPGPLLEVLARSGVSHLLMPEPDLEQAFLQLYSPSESDSDSGSASDSPADGHATPVPHREEAP